VLSNYSTQNLALAWGESFLTVDKLHRQVEALESADGFSGLELQRRQRLPPETPAGRRIKDKPYIFNYLPAR
jgi:hypothetical protein